MEFPDATLVSRMTRVGVEAQHCCMNHPNGLFYALLLGLSPSRHLFSTEDPYKVNATFPHGSRC